MSTGPTTHPFIEVDVLVRAALLPLTVEALGHERDADYRRATTTTCKEGWLLQDKTLAERFAQHLCTITEQTYPTVGKKVSGLSRQQITATWTITDL